MDQRGDLGRRPGARVRGGAARRRSRYSPSRVHFGGSTDDLIAVRDAVAIPVLKKDFHVDPIQLIEARALGRVRRAADRARAVAGRALREMTRRRARASISRSLVEVRDETELDRALDAGATIDRHQQSQSRDAGRSIRRPPSDCSRLIPRVGHRDRREWRQRHAPTSSASRARGADAVLVGSVDLRGGRSRRRRPRACRRAKRAARAR